MKTLLSLVIHIDNPGQNKLQIIKIIKEQLNLSIREAKVLVDSYPVDIDFHKIKMLKKNRLHYL